MVDHLGSTRVVTDSPTGTTPGTARVCHDYLPFGEEIPNGIGGRTGCYETGDGPGLKFTGKLRGESWEAGLDYFGARYFSGAQGRFTTPDEPFADQDPSDPQSWNLFSYVRNNPMGSTDPTGHDCISTSNQTDSTVAVSVTPGQCGSGGGKYVPGTVDMNSFTWVGNELSYSFNPYDTGGCQCGCWGRLD